MAARLVVTSNRLFAAIFGSYRTAPTSRVTATRGIRVADVAGTSVARFGRSVKKAGRVNFLLTPAAREF